MKIFHIDLSSKRARLALRFFTYGVMTVATVVLTALAIFYAMGYRFNQNQLTFEQGGLMQFRSTPPGAAITVDGRLQNFKTPGRANTSAGQHTVEMQLDGYHTWRKAVNLGAGQLLWLNYARFVPLSITTTPHKQFATLHAMLPSPDRRWLLLQEKPDVPVFIFADVDNEKKPVYTTFTVPDAALTRRDGKLGELRVVEWDKGSRYVLLEHKNAGGVHEFLRIDRTKPEDTINLSQRFRLAINSVRFAGTNANQLYVRTEDVLRRLDVTSDSASAALLTGVRAFNVYTDGTVSFVAEREATPGDSHSRGQYVGLLKENKEIVARHYPLGHDIKVAYSDYFGHNYLAISTGDSKVHVLRDVVTSGGESAEFAVFDLGHPVQHLVFSPGGRMLAATHGGFAAVQDIELNKTTHSTLHSGGNSSPPAWLDDYYLWTDAGGMLKIVEFDGQNGHDITAVAPGYSVMLTTDGKALFSLAKDTLTNGVTLQASQLIKD